MAFETEEQLLWPWGCCFPVLVHGSVPFGDDVDHCRHHYGQEETTIYIARPSISTTFGRIEATSEAGTIYV